MKCQAPRRDFARLRVRCGRPVRCLDLCAACYARHYRAARKALGRPIASRSKR